MKKIEKEIIEQKNCRICGSSKPKMFLSLGSMPPPNMFPQKEQLKNESFYPLDVSFCKNCGLVQLKHVVHPDIMFRDYIYVTSASQTMIKHLANLAEKTAKRFKVQPNSLVVDIGSNDGTFLSHFKKFKVRTLGIDPAENLKDVAKSKGIENIVALFSNRIANLVSRKYGKAKVITAINVVAHAGNLDDFFKGIKTLLSENGVFIAEFPYLVDLVEKDEFDTIYHEHLSYFSIKPLLLILEKYNLELFGVKRIPIHGGSIRLLIRHSRNKQKYPHPVKELLNLEEKIGLYNLDTYRNFAERVEKKKEDLLKLLRSLKSQGKKIVGYGAAAKGNILLNFCGIGPETLSYIVDSIPAKQGKVTPGTHIPIYPEKKLLEDMPEYALLLAWNFADEILGKNTQYKKQGGKFILIVPEIKIL